MEQVVWVLYGAIGDGLLMLLVLGYEGDCLVNLTLNYCSVLKKGFLFLNMNFSDMYMFILFPSGKLNG